MFDKLFIMEMANNHMGDLDHGLAIINEFKRVFDDFDFNFAIKFQYRELDSFIHPDYKGREDIKYVKRFSETRLAPEQFLKMKKELDKLGIISICTPFDEASVDLIEEHDFQIIKIASCSFTDWPLLERIAKTDKPLIVSTAGAELGGIDRVYDFLDHRDKDFCLMHCVGAYPTPEDDLELNQIDFLKERYKGMPVGYSTHEAPDNYDAVKMAIAKGAQVLERHVAVETEKYGVNAYSSTPGHVRKWLESAASAYKMCGVTGKRRKISEKEASDLRGLKRGVFLKNDLKSGDKITPEKIFYAIPNHPGQLLSNDISKYITYILTRDLEANAPVMNSDVGKDNVRPQVIKIINDVSSLIKQSGITLKDKLELELSHHYGIKEFYNHGCTIITCINREYCKKIILLLPGQENPTHRHVKKEETFNVLYGELSLTLDGETRTYHAGDIITVERDRKHSFASQTGAVMEEISTTHFKNDSFYDEDIPETSLRKTYMTFRTSWVNNEIK